jgi:hypothetical protein
MIRTTISLAALAATAAAQTNLYTFHGTQAESDLGTEIASIGDVDQDGVPDFLLAVPGETAFGTIRVLSGANGMMIRALHSPFPNPNFGVWMKNVGDVDRDGIDDVGVVAPEANPGSSTVLRVFSPATGNVVMTAYGPLSPLIFGHSFTGVGDVDGDGAGDLLVHTQGDPVAGGTGIARLYSGGTGALLTVLGVVPGSAIVAGVSGIGDLDGDLVPDLVVGEPWYSVAGAVEAGRITFYSGATYTPIYELIGNPGERIGGILARIADIDGDGIDELLTAGRSTVPGLGAAFLHSGATGARLLTVRGDSANDGFGVCIADAGDVDGDGTHDLVVGTGSGQSAKVFSGATGATLFTMRETWFSGLSPVSVAGLGDLDGDGRSEVAIGSGVDSTNGHFSGRARIVSDGVTPLASSASCPGDGSAGSCPCGNAGAAGAGCANSTGGGASLAGFGTTSVAEDLFFLEGDHLPPNVLVVLFTGTSTSPTAAGLAGAGLRCIGGTIRRVTTRTANQAGVVWLGPTLSVSGGWLAGETRHFQAFYRNPTGPCGEVFNVSNAASVIFAP